MQRVPATLIRLVLALILVTACVLALRGNPEGDHRERATGRPDAVPAEPTRAPAQHREERTVLGEGGTLAAALDRLGIEPGLREKILAMASRHIDPTRLAPHTGLVARFDEDGRLVSVAVRSEPERFLRVIVTLEQNEVVVRPETVELAVKTEVETVGGVVRDSVAQALSHSVYAAKLTHSYADIFQWDVDLLVEPRPGDVVRIVHEVRRLGPVPGDLPEYGNVADREGQFLGLGRILAAAYEGEIASARAFWVDDGKVGGNFYDERGLPLRKSFLKSPLNYRRISSGFSRARRHPISRKVVPHHGVDFAAATGTPVASTADGRVVSAGWDGGLGRAVRIRHGSEYVTVYGHLSRTARGIRRGVDVRQGQVIGYVGATGRATGPHLHYSVLRNGAAINPLRMKNPPAEPLDTGRQPWLTAARRRWTPLLAAVPLRGEGLDLANVGASGTTNGVLPGS